MLPQAGAHHPGQVGGTSAGVGATGRSSGRVTPDQHQRERGPDQFGESSVGVGPVPDDQAGRTEAGPQQVGRGLMGLSGHLRLPP